MLSDGMRKILTMVSATFNRQLAVNVAMAKLLDQMRRGEQLSEEDIEALMGNIGEMAIKTSDLLSEIVEELRP